MKNETRRGAWRLAAAAALALAALQGHADPKAAALTAATLTHWMDGYKAAWENRDPDAAAALFTEKSTYQETPYDKPFEGPAGVREYWTNVTRDQRNVKFEYQVIAVHGDTGVAHWSAKFESATDGAPVGLDGIFVLDFAPDLRCSRLREWWHLAPSK